MAKKQPIRLPSDKDIIQTLETFLSETVTMLENPNMLQGIESHQKEALYLALRRAATISRNIIISLG
jgi:hypothetical protein